MALQEEGRLWEKVTDKKFADIAERALQGQFDDLFGEQVSAQIDEAQCIDDVPVVELKLVQLVGTLLVMKLCLSVSPAQTMKPCLHHRSRDAWNMKGHASQIS